MAYDVLYRNIYKTSINVAYCLESYCNHFFARYSKFANIIEKYEGPSASVAQVYWKHA